jgi:hypothetical protein
MGEWISVDDRLPELQMRVLIYGRTIYPQSAQVPFLVMGGVLLWIDENGPAWSGDIAAGYYAEVTHWQPLPTPPD